MTTWPSDTKQFLREVSASCKAMAARHEALAKAATEEDDEQLFYTGHAELTRISVRADELIEQAGEREPEVATTQSAATPADLLPCPFCGGEDVKCFFNPSCDCCGQSSGSARCGICGAETSHHDSASEAQEAWNTRHQPSGDAAKLLRRALEEHEDENGRFNATVYPLHWTVAARDFLNRPEFFAENAKKSGDPSCDCHEQAPPGFHAATCTVFDRPAALSATNGEAVELLKCAVELIEGDLVGAEWERACWAFTKSVRDFLTTQGDAS